MVYHEEPRMRIGIDARLWGESGVGRYIRNLVWELSKIDRVNQYILFLRDENEVGPRKLPENWQSRKVDIRWHTVEEQLRFPAILNRENLDLVHFPYFSVPIFYKRPFIVTIHDLILHHFPTGEATTLPLSFYQLKLLGYKFVISQAAKKAKKIITVSNATKKEIIRHLGVDEDKVIVTYEGMDYRVKRTIPYTLIPNPYFLYVGNAYPHKNLERLLEAFKKTYNLKPKTYNLVFVGKEDYFYKRLKEKVKKMGLVKNVIFYGEAHDEELSALYKNAKALVLPSLMEGFGLPAVEAMANKCLVVCSEIPALREVCGEAAIYFNPYDVNDIRNKMEVIYSNDLDRYSENVERGLKRVKIFSWQEMAKQTLKIYESI